MNMDELVKYILWVAVFILGLGGIYKLLGSLGLI